MTTLVLVLSLLGVTQDPAKIKESFKKGADWMLTSQQENGAWARTFDGKKHESLALTCLSVYALAKAPEELHAGYKRSIDQAVEYIASKQADDGSFAEPPGVLRTYVTSLALMVLAAVDRDEYKDRIQKAQAWLKKAQITEGLYAGGMGYGEEKKKGADLSNTALAAEAMHESGFDKNDEYWKRIAEFVARCQNCSETNVDPAWKKHLQEKGFKIGNDGSVFYTPSLDSFPAGVRQEDGAKVINGYGAMTYAAIKTFLYAGLSKDDPRVQAAVEWVREHWSVDAHPGFPEEKDKPASKRSSNQGLFYYYMLLARALETYGENPIKTSKGEVDWRKALGEKLLSLQKADGSWANENPRWWENDPSLCTPYVLHIYGVLLRK